MPNYQRVGFSRMEANGILNSSQVPANRTDFNVVFRAADLPAEMINNALAEATNDPNTPGKASETLQNIALFVTATDPTKGPFDRVPINVVNFDLSTQDIEIWGLFPDVFAIGDTPHTWLWGGDGNPNTLDDNYGKLACHDNHLAFYTMDDLTVSTIKDYGTNGVDGIQTGTPGPVASDIGFAQDYVSSSSEAHDIAGKFGNPSAFTGEFWFEADNVASSMDLFSIGDNMVVRISSITRFSYRSGGIWYNIDEAVDLRDGLRHHIVIMGTSGNQRLYRDGNLIGTLAQGAPGYDQGTNSTIGKHGNSASGYWDGIIDNVILSPEVKNDDYVTTVYNNQKPSSTFITKGTSPEPNLLTTVMKPPIRGIATLGSGVTFINVAIGSNVDMNLAFLKFTYRTDTTFTARPLMAGEIFGGNMMQFNVFTTSGGSTIKIEWQVIEFEKDSGVFVQHNFGTTTSTSLTTVLPVTINPTKSWLTFSPGIINTTGWNGGELFDYAIVNDGTEVLQTRQNTNSVYIVRQVISYHNCITQQVAYSSGLASVLVAITTVNVNKSFAFASSRASVLTAFDELARVNLTASQVTLEKYSSGATKSGFVYVVEFTDNTGVGILQFDLAASANDQNESISNVDLTKTFLWDGNSDYQVFPTDDATTLSMNSKNTLVSLDLDSSTNIRVRRDGTPAIIARGTVYIINQKTMGGDLVNSGLVDNGLVNKGLSG